ncbi:MAG: lipopolysaccharide biosynthesis protein [Fluviicola sp.]
MKLRERLLKSQLLRSVLVLMTGTVFAQGLSYLVFPLLTTLYAPSEMGVLDIYVKIVGFVSAVGTARFEVSLPLPKNEGHSFLIYKLSLRIARYVIVGMAVAWGVYFLFEPPVLTDIWFLIITLISTLFVIFINLGTNWAIRNKAFKQISRQKIVGSFTNNGMRLVLGYLSFGAIGLVLATMLGYMISSFWFVRDFFRLDRKKYKNYSRKKSKVLVREYREFPLVNLPHVAIDLGRELLIAALVLHYFDIQIFGLYSVAHLILKLPLTVLGTSIGQVFYGETSEMVNQGKSVFPLLRKTILTLFGLSLIPFSVIFFFGEDLFELLMDDRYIKAGYYSEIMTMWLMMVFVVSPVSNLSLVLNRQKEFFLLGIVGSTIQLFCFGVLPILYGTNEAAWERVLWTVTIAQTIYFVGVAIISLYYAKKGVKGAVTK